MIRREVGSGLPSYEGNPDPGLREVVPQLLWYQGNPGQAMSRRMVVRLATTSMATA